MSRTYLLALFFLLLRLGPSGGAESSDLRQPTAVRSDISAVARLGMERTPGTQNDRTVLVRRGVSFLEGSGPGPGIGSGTWLLVPEVFLSLLSLSPLFP